MNRCVLKLVTIYQVRFKLAGRGLDKKDWFGKSDPYLEIFRLGASPPCLVYRSQVSAFEVCVSKPQFY